jgi:hypothetical protein
MGRNNSRIRGTKKKRTRKKKGGNSYEKGELCKICHKRKALARYCANWHYFCYVCIEQWTLQGNAKGCPACRADYEPEYAYSYWDGSYVDGEDIGLVKEYIYGDCCTPCETSMCGTVLCRKPSCRGCKKNTANKIIGIEGEKHDCKKKSNGGGKKKRRRRGTKKKVIHSWDRQILSREKHKKGYCKKYYKGKYGINKKGCKKDQKCKYVDMGSGGEWCYTKKRAYKKRRKRNLKKRTKRRRGR